MGAATLVSTYIDPRSTTRSRRAFKLKYTAINFNAPSVECPMSQDLLNEGPYFTVEGIFFFFYGTVGTSCATMYLKGPGNTLTGMGGWVTTRDPQGFYYGNLGVPCYWTDAASDALLQFYILAGYAAADDFMDIAIWGYIDEYARDEYVAQQPIRVAQDGWYSLKKRRT